MAIELTSREEIEQVYSSVAVELRVDDMSSGDEDEAIDDIVDGASDTVASYTLRWYNTSDLVNSQWIRRRATIIACYYLSMRRANGTQFTREYERVIADLERFLTDKPPIIPADDGFPVPVRTSLVPTVSAYIVDDRQRHRKLRVKQDYSTKPYPGQYGYTQPHSSDYL